MRAWVTRSGIAGGGATAIETAGGGVLRVRRRMEKVMTAAAGHKDARSSGNAGGRGSACRPWLQPATTSACVSSTAREGERASEGVGEELGAHSRVAGHVAGR
jgi:hypothetical protein